MDLDGSTVVLFPTDERLLPGLEMIGGVGVNTGETMEDVRPAGGAMHGNWEMKVLHRVIKGLSFRRFFGLFPTPLPDRSAVVYFSRVFRHDFYVVCLLRVDFCLHFWIREIKILRVQYPDVPEI